jgi:hypothetical protein
MTLRALPRAKRGENPVGGGTQGSHVPFHCTDGGGDARRGGNRGIRSGAGSEARRMDDGRRFPAAVSAGNRVSAKRPTGQSRRQAPVLRIPHAMSFEFGDGERHDEDSSLAEKFSTRRMNGVSKRGLECD